MTPVLLKVPTFSLPSHPLRGIQGGEPGTLLQETGGTGLLDSQIFLGTDLLIPTLTFLRI